MSIYNILKELESNNSGKFKLKVLEREKNNELLKEFFRLSLDKSLIFYIKKIPKYATPHKNSKNLGEAMALLDKLSRRIFTGNRAKFFVSKLLTECTQEDSEVIQRILKKDPKCKVSVKSVSKIWPNLIKIWPCMLCERATEKNLKNIKYPALIQEKADGLRFNIIYKDGEIEYRSRNGKYINLCNALDDQIKIIAKNSPYKDFVIDGEGLIIKHQYKSSKNWNDPKYSENEIFESRRTGNGIFNKCIQNTVTKEDTDLIRVKVWDIIPYDEFMNNNSEETMPYKQRITILKNILKKDPDINEKIALTLTKIVNNESQVLQFYKKMLEKEKEGAILKNLDSVWENKRSKNQVKFKIVKQLDLKCIDTYTHKKKKNWIGGLTLVSSDGKVKVNVGSGLKDKDRKLEPIKFLNKIIMIETNGLINSKNNEDEYSLFLPVFKEIRFDKDEADSLEKIKDEFLI